MGQIGYFGAIKFHVNMAKDGGLDALSFSNFNWKASINVEEHRRYHKKPFLEFVDKKADEITLEIYLSAYMHQSPMEKWLILRSYCHKSYESPFFLGGKRIGDYNFIITDVSNAPTEVFKDGRLVAIKVSCTFKESAGKKKTNQKNKVNSSKKKKSGKLYTVKKITKKKKSTGYDKYEVKEGDSLWSLAKKFYGKGSKYMKIYNANKTASKGFHVINNPDKIMPGWIIKIPK